MVTKITRLWTTLFLILISTAHLAAHVTFSAHKISPNKQKIDCSITLKPKDFIYKDNINFSVDHPDIKLSDWHVSTDAVAYYDPTFKNTKKIFNKNFTITLHATRIGTEVNDAHLYFTYYQHSQKKITQKLFPLTFDAPGTTLISNAVILTTHQNNVPSSVSRPETVPASTPTTTPKNDSWTGYLSSLVQTTDSLWMRLLLVLLLGMLLSLTPCVYPMIPITVGILQSQGCNSVFKNFLTALAYTTGIASTFALLGLSAAFTGQLFGSFMSNPIVIITIVAFMAYLAGSMLGLYEMYIPRSLQSNNATIKNGSYFSTFLFGAVSGTVASPCLSPGLVLLLGLVTTLGSKIMGFLLLFFFGVGLGIPLLIIGTFSSSLNMLPKAGMWMVEIKTLFGFIMLAMCFYFLSNIISWHILMWSIAVFVLCAGTFYLHSAKKNSPSLWRTNKNILGVLLVAGSVFLFTKSYQATYMNQISSHENIWLAEYANAIKQARTESKYVFLDVGAPFCSICKAIDRQLLSKDNVVTSLKNFVPIKIDSSDRSHADICKKFKIMGVPAFIVINPFDEQEVKRWGSELYEVTPNDFISELKTCVDKPILQT